MEEPLTSPQLVRVNKSGEEIFSIFFPSHCFFFAFGWLKIEIIIRNDEGLVWW